MSLGVSDFMTDEELDELVEDGLSHITYVSDKNVHKKKTMSKPPLSPRSPYLTSLSRKPRRSVTTAWKATLSQSPMKPDYDSSHSRAAMSMSSISTPDYLKDALGMNKPRHARSATNGYTPGTPDYKEKEDMYDEIMELKKTLQAHKAEGDQMRAKVRRLEEDKIRKEKQMEQLLDPTKGPEYTRSLVDKKTEGKSVVQGLKQRNLRLEQQNREKEEALSKLKSELKTTIVEEMKISMETYYEEVLRLRVLLASAEKSNKVDAAEHRKQEKVLRATVLKLTKDLKQLQEENTRLQQEAEQEASINAETRPANRAKGYIEWSKQRLVRRLLDLERRLEEKRHRHSTKDATTTKAPSESRLIATTTGSEVTETSATTPVAREMASTTSSETHMERLGAAVGDREGDGGGGGGGGGGGSGGDLRQECVRLRGVARRLREERNALQEALSKKDEEVRRASAEREEAERTLRERTTDHERQAESYREEIESLSAKIIDLENRLRQAQDSNSNQTQENPSSLDLPASSSSSVAVAAEEQARREEAAKTIQTHWHKHHLRDTVLVQSALRAHLCRHKQLYVYALRKKACNSHSNNNAQSGQSATAEGRRVPSCSSSGSSGVRGDGLEEEEVALLQSALRAHRRRHRATTHDRKSGSPAAVKEALLPPPPPSSSPSSS
ncbi:IQ domain-containing protein E [Engraulis encrasicolus]|uniref:IQ domain-containing protein E n=1 Tax=Engraulis encrasicolus TaxID=184585 RepID=UPI002FD698B6